MNPRPRLPLHAWLAILLVLATFALVAEASRRPFERLPHLEDEVAYLYQAKIIAGGHLVIDSPAPSRAFWQPFVVDYDGRRFGKYPPGWPLLLAIGVLAGQPWLVNAALAALAVALTYRLGRELYDPATGLVAALLTAASPTFLLLSGSLMSHTAALTCASLLAYALWRLGRDRRRRWAILGGAALGLMAAIRPLTAVGVFLPFALGAGLLIGRIVWRSARQPAFWGYFRYVLRAGPRVWRFMWRGLRPTFTLLAVFGLAALAFTLLIPIFNTAATGDPTANLYTLVWPYDRVGFGPEFGRSGHSLADGLLNMRLDLIEWSGDLFGWSMPEGLHAWLWESVHWQIGTGLSWILLPVGLIAGRKRGWTWLLAGIFAGLVGVHLLYWIGAQSYSARYYSEAIPALALISAAGITALARRLKPRPLRAAGYAALLLAVALSLTTYTPALLGRLWRFNNVGQDKIAALDALRDGRPVLLLVTGADQRSWRDWGTYMALTSPYLDSDVVAARERGREGELESLLARFAGRQILILTPAGTLLPYDG